MGTYCPIMTERKNENYEKREEKSFKPERKSEVGHGWPSHGW